MASQWFCKIFGDELGPMTSRQLVELARNNNLLPEDPVRKDDSRWVPARKIKGLFEDEKLAKPQERQPLGDVTTFFDPNKDDHHVLGGVERPSDSTAVDENDEDESPTGIVRNLEPGSILGNYIILQKLGEGGMGMVLKAQHRRMERLVALKVLHGDATRSPAAVKRFQQEVKAAAKLVHPNIVTAHDADEAGGVHFLVMEYVDGVVLADLIVSKGPLPVEDAVNYTLQAARGLAFAHSEGVVHRDIKPGNLLVDKRGTVKILDMGLARIKDTATAIAEATAAEALTRSGQVLGTLDYMSPEQAEDASKVDHRADIYSLGCSFFRLLTGKPPYMAESVINKIVAHRNHPIPSLVQARKGVPADIDAVFHRMVAKLPQDRYPSMDEVIVDLEMFSSQGRVRAETLRAAKMESGRSSVGSSSPSSSQLRSSESARHTPVVQDDDDDSFDLAPVEETVKPEPTVAARPTFAAGKRPASPAARQTAAPAAPSSTYFCKVMGEELGPLTFQQLSEMKRKKQITSEDMVRRSNEDRWFPAMEIDGLF